MLCVGTGISAAARRGCADGRFEQAHRWRVRSSLGRIRRRWGDTLLDAATARLLGGDRMCRHLPASLICVSISVAPINARP